ncbi:8-amino-7-oxononanoate synthase [Vibrio sp. RC27]
MPAFSSRIDQALSSRQNQGLTRNLVPILAGNQVEIEHNGKRFLNFSNNDYLGLANDPELIGHWQKGLSLYGAGSAASPLVTGFCSAHKNLETQLCEWLGFERAILFNSGYSANQAVLFTLLEQGDHLLQDKLNHASLMEAGMLSPASMRRFKHNSVEHLTSLVNPDIETLIVTEGVFSMDGDRSPLGDIAQLVNAKSNCALMVDDAHGVGIIGNEGQGSCYQAGVTPDILVVTFGKAFGMSGAAILCSESMGDFLTQFARHHIYSTAMPPSQAYALSHAIYMIQTQHWRREKLAELETEYQHRVGHFSQFVETSTPIKPLIIGDTQKVMNAALAMKQNGIWVTAIRPPTVPINSGRLRITLTANHSKEQVTTLCRTLSHVLETRL